MGLNWTHLWRELGAGVLADPALLFPSHSSSLSGEVREVQGAGNSISGRR